MIDKENLFELLQKYGYNSSSFQLVDISMNYFSVESSNGIIGYVSVGKTFVCAGDPLCSDDDFFNIVHQFRLFAKSKKKRILFLQVTSKAKEKLVMMGFGSLKFGEEAIFDLASYTFAGGERKSVRQHANSATNKGVVVTEYLDEDKQILSLVQRWSNTKTTKGFSFLLSVNPLENKEKKKIFVAKLDDQVVGYLSAVPIYARDGYYLEDIIRSADAPSGTNHLLVKTAVEYFASQGKKMVSLGTAPLGKIKDEESLEHKRILALLNYAYNHLNGYYNFKGLFAFKESFTPSSWEKKYLCFYPEKLKASYFISIIKAYSNRTLSGLVLERLKKITRLNKISLKEFPKKVNFFSKHKKKLE